MRTKKIHFKFLMVSLLSIYLLIGCKASPTLEVPPEQPDTPQVTSETPTAYPTIDYTPNFSSKDLIYFIVTDRFKVATDSILLPDVNPDDPLAYHGGNLKGITESLAYIKSLGATAIWITPVQENGPKGYHGYWIHDFWNLDPHLGTLEDLKDLVEGAHALEMKVLLDYVVNHTGYDSPWLSDPQKATWFNPKRNIVNWTDTKQLETGWLFGLPDLNLEAPEVEQFFIDNALWWIRETGIDGMRLDTVKHVPKSFWNNWTQAIKAEFPDFYFLGEVWSEHVSVLERYLDVGIDGMTNYPLYEGFMESLMSGQAAYLEKATLRDQKFSASQLSGIFVDNHDNERLISRDPVYGLEKLRIGLVWAYTYPAIPILYYGTEVGLEGGKDPDNRRDMPWESMPQPRLLALTQDLAKLRPLLDQTFEWLYTSDGIALYRRGDYLIVLNFSNQEQHIEAKLDISLSLNTSKNKLDAYPLNGIEAPNLTWSSGTNMLNGVFPPFGIGIYPLK